MRDVVVLCSGGVDSAVLAHRAHQSGRLAALVFCNYGQPASLMEWRAAIALARLLEVRLHEVPLTTVWAADMVGSHGEPGPRIVPVRNLLMIAHAANYAASIGASTVWLGAIGDDAPLYHDCRPAFARAVGMALDGDGLTLEMPLSHQTKDQVVVEAARLGCLAPAWSCYTPRNGGPCGTCDSCRQRRAAERGAA